VIPLHDNNPTTRFAWATFLIIVANVVVFLLWEPTFGSQAQQQVFFFCQAEIPWETTHQTNLAHGGPAAAAQIREQLQINGTAAEQFLLQKCPDKSWWQSVFVAMFLHGGWIHIGGNMLFLWIFGNNVEDRVGIVPYVLLYLAGGIAATALQVAIGPTSVVPNLGASGAIAGVLGTYLVLFPKARVLTLIIFFIITVIELPASVVLGAWFVLQLFSGVGSLGSQVNGGVAYWAHVGGFALGVIAAVTIFRRYRKPPQSRYPSAMPPRPDFP
jgi:membrane associated rhomboid family serine protease